MEYDLTIFRAAVQRMFDASIQWYTCEDDEGPYEDEVQAKLAAARLQLEELYLAASKRPKQA